MIRRNILPLLFVLVCGLASYFIVRSAEGAELPTVQPASDWAGLLILGLVLLLIAVGVLLHRRYPSAASQADTAMKAEAVKVLGEIRDVFHKNPPVVPAAPADAPAPEPAPPPPPAGKNGVAGVLTLAVTGDPKADLAAFQAAYFS